MELDQIAFRQVQPGYWTIVVNDTVRPVIVIRQGRRWVVQMPLLDPQVPGSRGETQVGSTRSLRDAKGLMVAAWLTLDAARELARHDATQQAVAI